MNKFFKILSRVAFFLTKIIFGIPIFRNSRATFNVFSYFIMAYTSSLFSILGTCQINLAYLQNIGVIEVKNWFCCILLFYFKFIIL